MVSIRSPGSVNGHVNTVAWNEQHNTTLANQQQGAFMLMHRTGGSHHSSCLYEDVTVSYLQHPLHGGGGPVNWRERPWPINIESVFSQNRYASILLNVSIHTESQTVLWNSHKYPAIYVFSTY